MNLHQLWQSGPGGEQVFSFPGRPTSSDQMMELLGSASSLTRLPWNQIFHVALSNYRVLCFSTAFLHCSTLVGQTDP